MKFNQSTSTFIRRFAVCALFISTLLAGCGGGSSSASGEAHAEYKNGVRTIIIDVDNGGGGKIAATWMETLAASAPGVVKPRDGALASTLPSVGYDDKFSGTLYLRYMGNDGKPYSANYNKNGIHEGSSNSTIQSDFLKLIS